MKIKLRLYADFADKMPPETDEEGTAPLSLPEGARIGDVLDRFERFDRKRCHFGNRECSDSKPCLAHDRWKKVVEAEHSFLKDTTIHEISVGAIGRRTQSGGG